MLKLQFLKSEVFIYSFKEAVKKLMPHRLIGNPVILIVWLIAFAITILALCKAFAVFTISDPYWFINTMMVAIWLIIFISNFVESVVQYSEEHFAKQLLHDRDQIKARKIEEGLEHIININMLKIGDYIIVKAGETIPCDGIVIEGVALVDEAAITGESAPVIRDISSNRCEVVAGSKVISDFIKVQINREPSLNMLSHIEEIVNTTERRETFSNQSLNYLLLGFTIIYIVMCACLYVSAGILNFNITFAEILGILICVMPTTIAGLISPIGVAAIERLMRRNIVPFSQNAIESSGDIDVLIFDKTGTITEGNRKAVSYRVISGTKAEFLNYLELSSLDDLTLEGKSIIELISREKKLRYKGHRLSGYKSINFTANTKVSGAYYQNNKILKGSYDAIIKDVEN
jgi:K+-transporting ATPase ATPase B chain